MISTATGNGKRRFPIPFLRQVAEHYRADGEVCGKCFIFPNRRSIAFFRKYLCEIPCGRPFIMPQMYTINDFFCKAAGSSATDRVRLLLELYDCYSTLNAKAESLDEFVFWGDVILSDFDDVDKYLADADQLFTNVADFKQIQDDYSYLTPTQKSALEAFLGHFFKENGRLTVDIASENPNVKARFLQIWNLLKPLYHAQHHTHSDKADYEEYGPALPDRPSIIHNWSYEDEEVSNRGGTEPETLAKALHMFRSDLRNE